MGIRPRFKVGDCCSFNNRSGTGNRSGEECSVIAVLPRILTGRTYGYTVRFTDGFEMTVREEELAHRAH